MTETRGLVWARGSRGCRVPAGLTTSAVLDLPGGAVIVWSLALLAVIIAAIQTPRHTEG